MPSNTSLNLKLAKSKKTVAIKVKLYSAGEKISLLKYSGKISVFSHSRFFREIV